MKKALITLALCLAASTCFALESETNSNAYISKARDLTTSLISTCQALIDMQDRWNALDYGNTLRAGTSDNTGITAAQVGSVIFDTTNATCGVLLGTGHKTNVFTIAK